MYFKQVTFRLLKRTGKNSIVRIIVKDTFELILQFFNGTYSGVACGQSTDMCQNQRQKCRDNTSIAEYVRRSNFFRLFPAKCQKFAAAVDN